MLRVDHAHHRQPCSLLLCKIVLHRGLPTGWPATNRCQADISDRHLFDFQLVASDYTDCPLRYTRLSSILSQKAGHNTCHLQVHQKLIPTNYAHCCSARLFCTGATQPGGRPPTDLTKQTSAIIISSTSSSLLLSTPIVYCTTAISVIF